MSATTAKHQPQTTVRRHEQTANGLQRERVTEIQRVRMLAAMAAVACEHGAANVTVAHVVERAGVSRRTFYEIFDDVEDCLLAAIDDALVQASERVLPAYAISAGARWSERLRRALGALLGFLDEQPDVGRLLVVQTLAAGPRALRRRAEALGLLIAAVEATASDAPVRPLVAEGVVGGALAILHARLCEEQQPGALIELLNPLMSMIVLPYLGQAAARRELDRPVPKSAGAPVRRPSHDQLNRLDMRLTYRTMRVLMALAADPGSSNRRVADAAGVADQGQMSKLLARLRQLGLIENTTSTGPTRGEPNAWTLTSKGWQIQNALTQQPSN